MRQVLRLGLVVLIVLISATAGDAQTLGTIAGVVKDGSGAVLPGTSVEVSSPVLIEKSRTAVTDCSGQHRIINLPLGTYDVAFSLSGFSTVKLGGIEVLANFTAPVNAE